MKNIAVFLGPFKPAHSTIPSGDQPVAADGVLVDFAPLEDLVILSSLEDPDVIWLL
jgi:hypothetical protein